MNTVRQGKGELLFLGECFRFPSRPVLIVRMLLHMQRTESLRLVDERPFLCIAEQFPLCAKTLADLRVVHLWVFLCHLSALGSRPDHEGVHRAFDVIRSLRHDDNDHRENPLREFKISSVGDWFKTNLLRLCWTIYMIT